MIKAGNTVRRETKYIALCCAVLGVLMQIIFLLLKKWDYTVFLGNILSFIIAVLNFYFMGVSVQKSLSLEASEARKVIKASQGIRNIFIFIGIVIGVVLPFFNTVAVVLPVFFPRIAVSFRPLIKVKEVIAK